MQILLLEPYHDTLHVGSIIFYIFLLSSTLKYYLLRQIINHLSFKDFVGYFKPSEGSLCSGATSVEVVASFIWIPNFISGSLISLNYGSCERNAKNWCYLGPRVMKTPPLLKVEVIGLKYFCMFKKFKSIRFRTQDMLF